MNSSLSMFAVISTFLLSGIAAHAETYQCKSWDNFKEKVYAIIQVQGDLASIALDLDGVKSNTVANVQPWHNFTPNRCGSYAQGLQFQIPLPNVHHLHIVTEAAGVGCYDPSTISYDGIEWAGIYLSCNKI